MNNEKQVFWHSSRLTLQERIIKNGHQPGIVWFTGFSGSGKSTLAFSLEYALFQMGIQSYVLDGDNIRHGLNQDLGFEKSQRQENIRRIGEVTKLLASAGMFVIVSFISPYKRDRLWVKELLSDFHFFEVYVDCPIEVCENRDPKGLYKKARNGTIKNFTGIGGEYEIPENPDLILNTNEFSGSECLKSLLRLLERENILNLKKTS